MHWLLTILSALCLIGFGCAAEYTTDDDDTYGEDDDVSDDDDTSGDDDTSTTDDDDVTDDDVTDDDDDSQPGNSCNDWDPIDVPGATWTYQSSYQFIIQGELRAATGTEVVQTGGTTYFYGSNVYQRLGAFTGENTGDWYGYNDCGNGGNMDFGSNVSNFGGQGAVLTVNSPEVMYLPYDPDQQAGYSWTSSYSQMVDAGEQGSGTWSATWNWQVVGMESITVGAGTFNAVHIHADYTTGDVLADSHSGTLDTWWVKGIGLVKWDEQRPSWVGQYVLRELQSYTGVNPM